MNKHSEEDIDDSVRTPVYVCMRGYLRMRARASLKRREIYLLRADLSLAGVPETPTETGGDGLEGEAVVVVESQSLFPCSPASIGDGR